MSEARPKNWSYSQLSNYEQCPHAYMYRRIVKLPEPPSWHLENGTYVHTLAENYLLGKMEALPKELDKFIREFTNLREKGASAEEEFSLNNKWELIPDGWTNPNTWLRLKIDARLGNYLVDFKTGKKYPAHIQQARLYANVMFMVYSEYDEVDVEFWYLSSGEVSSFTFTRDTLADDIAEWERRVAVMHNDATFDPTPHQYCRNCYVQNFCTAYL